MQINPSQNAADRAANVIGNADLDDYLYAHHGVANKNNGDENDGQDDG